MGDRLVFGLRGGRFGAKRVLVAGLLVQAFGALASFFVRQLGEAYAVAALFGFTYAGVMPLYAVIVRENFPIRMMGTIIGGTAMAGSLGMSVGPLAGGWIVDTYANYGLLYVGSFGIGIGAVLTAMSFRPFPRGRHQTIPKTTYGRAAVRPPAIGSGSRAGKDSGPVGSLQGAARAPRAAPRGPAGCGAGAIPGRLPWPAWWAVT